MIFIAEPYREILGGIAKEPRRIFDDPAIVPWRTLEDRENCVWEIAGEGKTFRLHVKRFRRPQDALHAKSEALGYRALQERHIPAAMVAAWGQLADGRSFIATEDLGAFEPADKMVEGGFSFERILNPTAELAAALHNSGLHHRDLYLCHFMVSNHADRQPEIRLIDAMRVRELPGPLTRRRWIVKDLAQFWFSTTRLPISDLQRDAWLSTYVERTKMGGADRLRGAIVRKSNAIRAHDRRLRIREPGRNISIPNPQRSSNPAI